MKKQFSILILMLALTTSAFAQVKVGYMNPGEVLEQLDSVTEVETQIDSLVAQRDRELIAKSNQLQQDFAVYEEGKSVLSAEARANKEQELLDRNEQIEADRENYLNEIRQRRAQLMEPIIGLMDQAIKSVSTELGLDMVLNEITSYGDAIIFYSSEEKLNITSLVIEKIKAEQ